MVKRHKYVDRSQLTKRCTGIVYHPGFSNQSRSAQSRDRKRYVANAVIVKLALPITSILLLAGCSSSTSDQSPKLGPTSVSLKPNARLSIFSVSPEPGPSSLIRTDSMHGKKLALNSTPLIDSDDVTAVTLHEAPGQYPRLVLRLHGESVKHLLDLDVNAETELAAQINNEIVSGGCVEYDGERELAIRSGIGGPDILSILSK